MLLLLLMMIIIILMMIRIVIIIIMDILNFKRCREGSFEACCQCELFDA